MASSKTSKSAAAIPASQRLHQFALGAICFVAGAAVMVIEISANRLLAPDFGNSLYTWTALIGVILVSFSVGGFLGGWWADKWRKLSLLGVLLAGAAAFTLLVPAISSLLTDSLTNAGLISGPTLMSMALFAIPGILLGAVSPASVRLFSLEGHDQHVGLAAGSISMLSSLGSFVGTFLSGFVLLASYGVRAIFLGTGGVLLILALLSLWMARSTWRTRGVSAGVAVVAFIASFYTEPALAKDIIYRKNTFYHRIEVSQQGDVRELKLDSTLEGGMRLNGDLVLGYQQYWKLVQLNDNLKIQRALFIGAGAFGMPEQVAKLDKSVEVDVVEIDPSVIEVGRKYFKLSEFENQVHAHARDARNFVQTSREKYDLIFGDAYNGKRHIPSHLLSREFFTVIHDHLSEHGVFIMNVISSIEGPQSELLGAVLGTLRPVFSNVEVFGVGGNYSDAQNVILLCSQESWKPWLEDRFYVRGGQEYEFVQSRVPAARWPEYHEDRPITDDWNPVDAIIARQLRE